jgi:hypothetical protein
VPRFTSQRRYKDRIVDKRFFVQNQTMDPPYGSNATAWFDTLIEAQDAADKIWRTDGRQEITDQQSGTILVRGSDPTWRPLAVVHSAQSRDGIFSDDGKGVGH